MRPATIWFGAYGGKTSVYLDLAARVTWTASLSAEAAGWLSFDGASSGTGPALVTLVTSPSTAGQQSAQMTVQVAGAEAPLIWPVVQISTEPLSTLNAAVLAVPFPTVPNVMEFGIAGKFIAQEIQKIPEPFDLIALVIVELVVVVAGLIAIALRQALSAIVPEPRTWFGAPEPYNALTLALPATAVFLTEETVLLAIYIAEQVINGGE